MSETNETVSNRVGANMNRCMECGWEETPAKKNYRNCPKCGAPFNNRWEERIFAYTSEQERDGDE